MTFGPAVNQKAPYISCNILDHPLLSAARMIKCYRRQHLEYLTVFPDQFDIRQYPEGGD